MLAPLARVVPNTLAQSGWSSRPHRPATRTGPRVATRQRRGCGTEGPGVGQVRTTVGSGRHSAKKIF